MNGWKKEAEKKPIFCTFNWKQQATHGKHIYSHTHDTSKPTDPVLRPLLVLQFSICSRKHYTYLFFYHSSMQRLPSLSITEWVSKLPSPCLILKLDQKLFAIWQSWQMMNFGRCNEEWRVRCQMGWMKKNYKWERKSITLLRAYILGNSLFFFFWRKGRLMILVIHSTINLILCFFLFKQHKSRALSEASFFSCIRNPIL